MSIPWAKTRPAFFIIFALLAGCGSLLPRGQAVTAGSWHNYREAQQAFDKIIPYQTTVEDLKRLKLDPDSNPNITILNYSDVIRRFIPGPTISAEDLDAGVLDCINAKAICKGYELDHKSIKRNRYGNFWADFLNFRRKVDVEGWRFNGVILIKDSMVVYKLTGGQPNIHEQEDSKNPLGPFQGFGESRLFNR